MSTEGILLVAGGTAVGVKLLADGAKKPAPTGPTAVGSIKKSQLSRAVAPLSKGGSLTTTSSLTVARPSTYLSFNPATIVDQSVKTLLAKKAEAEFNALSSEAKGAACRKLKEQFPANPQIQALDCNRPTFQLMLTAVGTAAGVAICGPACGALGAVVATWVGPKVEEWGEDAYNGIKDGLSDGYDAIKFW